MDVLLVAGLWLDDSAWDEVVPALATAGHVGVPVALPGQGDGSREATLDDQVAAVVTAVDAAGEPVLVVGHSAACTLAWLAADARPERVRGVVLVGGFPAADAQTYADFFAVEDGVMPFPGWEPFAGPDSDDLDEATRARVAANAHAVPEGVARGVVRLRDERRYRVPVIVVCPEFSPAQAQAAIDAGDIPELARAEQVHLVDLASGHWPMFSRPDELARVLAGAAAHTVGPDGPQRP